MAEGEVLDTLLHFFSYNSHGTNAAMMVIEMLMNDLDVQGEIPCARVTRPVQYWSMVLPAVWPCNKYVL